MEKLFLNKDIQLQPLVAQDGQDITIVYTDALLVKSVFIEFYEIYSDDLDYAETKTIISAFPCIAEASYSFELFRSDD